MAESPEETEVAQAPTMVDRTQAVSLGRPQFDARLAEGSMFGRYEIVQRLGWGGMAEVYKAYDPALDRFVALKVILPHLAVDPEFSVRFASEARLAARLSHPNVVTIYEVGTVDAQNFLAMQFVQGETLADRIAREGALPPVDALRIVEQIADALDSAHAAGIVHRDLKPANILLDTDHKRALLADFGIARAQDSATRLTRTGATMGTAAYMAPEQVTEEHGIGPAADRYALGIVAYEFLCGRVPFTAARATGVMFKHAYEPVPPIRQFNPHLSTAVEAVLTRALAKNPDERFATARDFVAELEAAVAQPGIASAPEPTLVDTVMPPAEPPAPTMPAPVSPAPVPPPLPDAPPSDAQPKTAPESVVPTPTRAPAPVRKSSHVLMVALIAVGALIATIAGLAVIGSTVGRQPTAEPTAAPAPVAQPKPTTARAAASAVATQPPAKPTVAPTVDATAPVTAVVNDWYAKQGFDVKSLRATSVRISQAGDSATVDMEYPVTSKQTASGIAYTIQTTAADTWQLTRKANQPWMLGKMTSTGYVGGVSAATATAVIQAIFKYDLGEVASDKNFDTAPIVPFATTKQVRFVQSTFSSLKAQGITSVVESLETATFCGFKQDSSQQISVDADEVWSHATYARSTVTEQQRNQHNPQVEHLVQQSGNWLVDSIDTDNLPADFPSACNRS